MIPYITELLECNKGKAEFFFVISWILGSLEQEKKGYPFYHICKKWIILIKLRGLVIILLYRVQYFGLQKKYAYAYAYLLMNPE